MTLTAGTQTRLLLFLTIFVLVAIWEFAAPKRRLTVSKAGRWLSNPGIILLDSLIVKLLFPVAAMGVAAAALKNDWGLFHLLDLPLWLSLLLTVLILDLIIYFQHLLFHAVPLLWRLHMMHRADLDLDVSTGLRFHPIEMLLSMLIRIAAVAALGRRYLVCLSLR